MHDVRLVESVPDTRFTRPASCPPGLQPSEGALRLRVINALTAKVGNAWKDAAAARFDHAGFWRALRALAILLEQWTDGIVEAEVSVIGVESHGIAIGLRCTRVAAHTLDARAGSEGERSTGARSRPAGCAHLDNAAEFAAARDLVRALGGSLVGYGQSQSVGLATIAWFPVRRPAGPSLTAPALQGRRILVVDDDMSVAQVLCEYFHLLGAQAIPADNAERAMWCILRLHVDALVTDLVMPGSDGFVLAQWIRRQSRFDSMRLIAFTGLMEADYFCRSAACGFDACILKPPQLGALALAVHGPAGPMPG